MLKRFPVYPFLFILFVIFNPVINNLDEINPATALRPLVVLVLVAGVLVLLFRALVKSWHYASYLAFLCLFVFFIFGNLYNLIAEKLPEEQADIYPLAVLAIVVLIGILLSLKKTWLRLGSNHVTPLLNLVFTFALISQALFGMKIWVSRSTSSIAQASGGNPLADSGAGESAEVSLDCSISPDIYWIIMDGYGRADVLKDLYGVDTTPFLAALEKQGFFIADQSHSNYIQTVYSIPSALNFSYLKPMPAKVSGYDYFPELLAENRLTALLKQCNYETVAFQSGFIFTHFPGADVFLSHANNLNELENLLLTGTPLDLLLDKLDVAPPERSFAAHRERVLYTFEKLAELPQTPGPKFVFAHIISPHPPFVFDAQGNPVQPNRNYSMVDGDDYKGSWEGYRKGYGGQVQYDNQLLEKTVSEIIRRSPTPPVIIIQGDHGPGAFLKWKSADQSCLWERTSILNAYYLPNGGNQYLYPSISPVNSFRVVLNTYFKANLEQAPNNTFFTSPQLGGEFIDVTERRESRANCR